MVFAPEDDETFEVDEETKQMLLESIADQGGDIPLEQVLEELRRRE
jgi:hypothetical protein